MASSWAMGLVRAAAALALAASGYACSANGPGQFGTTDGGADGPSFGGGHTMTGLAVDPPSATLDIVDDQIVTQTFTARALFADGTSQPISSGVSWSANYPAAGSINSQGIFTPSAQVGGPITVTAKYLSAKGSASLAVKLHYTQNLANASPQVVSALAAATQQDASCTWAYPYDGTVFPRGLAAPTLMWNGGGASDVYYVHLSSTYFELTELALAPPPSRLAADETTWTKFASSTSGKASLVVNRWDGAAATTLVHHTWTIAPASMRGTIYYWANNLGRVMRIKPGAAAPDDFANQAPLNDPNKYTQSSCLMTCHTVSADGSTLISGGGTFGGSYDLKGSQPVHYTGGTWGPVSQWQSIQWGLSAVSPTGKYIMTNSMTAVGLSLAVNGPSNLAGLYDTATGTKVPGSGLDGALLAMPAWSPEGSLIAYVDAGNPSSWSQGWNIPPPANLRVVDFDPKATPMASNPRDIVQVGNDPNQRINWPTISPDGKWVVYARGGTADTRYSNSDLYIASTQSPNHEARLAMVDGDGYPFAAGSRDQSWNFEPAFAPVAAGGYFWVVFTSRRTYGNALTGDKDHTKQLWVAAIDQSPQLDADASHPAFWLPGEAADSLNMRGYWALDPCKQDGQSCGSGTECCGGYCDQSADGGAAVCGSNSNGCSQNGDHCDTSADCCNASSGVSCINQVCSEPPPN
jgi:hypothetical protein